MSANEALNRVWSIFRSAGIADDLTIIEYVARLLLDESGLEIDLDERRLPRRPPQREQLESIKHGLEFAAEQVEGSDELERFAQLFDQHVLFRLSDMLAGGRYPTPRHITHFMRTLAQVGPTDSLADFACGSGGLLIGRPLSDPPPKTIGYEISPEWAKIARANLLLHGFPLNEETIQDGNALTNETALAPIRAANFSPSIFSSTPPRAEKFDCILMNPPFGEKVDPWSSQEALGQKISKSETALISLALLNLAPGGTAGFLSPSGLLFTNSTTDQSLRQKLVDENTLEAVVAFPKDAFQPYSPLQTNLLLFKNAQPPDNHRVWFFELEQDGYPSGRSRDLTQYPPPQTSDFPFIEQLWANREASPDARFPDEENPSVNVQWFDRETGYPGVVCTGIDHPIKSVEFISRPETETIEQEATEAAATQPPPRLLIELVMPPTEPKRTVPIDIPPEVWALPGLTSTATETDDPEDAEPEADAPEEESPEQPEALPTMQLLSRPAWGVAIAFFRQGQGTPGESPRLLGVSVDTSDIREQVYDLRPERYVVTPVESQSLDSPSELLKSIYLNQLQLSKRIDSLFGHLELPPITTQKLPSPVLEDEALPLVAALNQEQKDLWDKVCEKTTTENSDNADNYETAVLFTPRDISQDNSEAMAEAIRTLDLMERMGLIVPVTIAEGQSDESTFFYRRVTERDLWQSDSGTSNSGEET